MGFKLELEGVGKSYQQKPVFQGLSARFISGVSYIVAGPNGSGKSTLLRIICGLLRPSQGRVTAEFNGTEAGGPYERGQYMGYLSPELQLYNRLTAYENLEFFGAVRGLGLQGPEVESLLEKVQLKDSMHLPAGAFSSGMKQRLKLAFALIHRPFVLLLDEPSTNLDAAGKALVVEIIEEQLGRGTVITASNDPEEVDRFGQEIIRLGQGTAGAVVERSDRGV